MRRWVATIDLLCVVIFVVIGLKAHGHAESLSNISEVAGPFLAGSLLGTVAVWRLGLAATGVRAGLVAAVITVAVGQTLRVLVGQGTAVAFIFVSLSFVILFFVGWRLVFSAVARSVRTA
jgi:hypothetical protein